MDIKCRKTSCKFNDGLVCKAKEINITKAHCCCTFEKGDKGEDTSSKIFLEHVEYAPFVHCKNFKVYCGSKCLFNKKGECYANGIIINDVSSSPICLTHIDK